MLGAEHRLELGYRAPNRCHTVPGFAWWSHGLSSELELAKARRRILIRRQKARLEQCCRHERIGQKVVFVNAPPDLHALRASMFMDKVGEAVPVSRSAERGASIISPCVLPGVTSKQLRRFYAASTAQPDGEKRMPELQAVATRQCFKLATRKVICLNVFSKSLGRILYSDNDEKFTK